MNTIAYFARDGLYYVRAIGPRKRDEWRDIAKRVSASELPAIVGDVLAGRIVRGEGKPNPWLGTVLRNVTLKS